MSTNDDFWSFPGCHEYEGIVYCSAFRADALDKIKELHLDPNDILISNYPKSGNYNFS